MISFDEAKSIASKAMETHFDVHGMTIDTPYLSDFYLEEEASWMFFKREDIEIPPEKWSAEVAYVISKIDGDGRGVGYDKSSLDDCKAMNKMVSDYFIKKNKPQI